MSKASSALVWITRAEPGASATAARVEAAGWTPVIAPLLAVRVLPDVTLDLTDVAALAFTSAGAVRAFAAISPVRDRPVFAVGEATAAAARIAGFIEVSSADGDVGDLAGLIIGSRERLRGRILHPGATILAGDLVGDLIAAGIEAQAVALYETLAVDPADTVNPLLDALDVVLVHSPRAGETLAAFLADHPAPRLRLLAISEAAAAPLVATAFRDRRIAAHPREADLLLCLGGLPA
jgi:uroporphyrinogen-III synthase